MFFFSFWYVHLKHESWQLTTKAVCLPLSSSSTSPLFSVLMNTLTATPKLVVQSDTCSNITFLPFTTCAPHHEGWCWPKAQCVAVLRFMRTHATPKLVTESNRPTCTNVKVWRGKKKKKKRSQMDLGVQDVYYAQVHTIPILYIHSVSTNALHIFHSATGYHTDSGAQ